LPWRDIGRIELVKDQIKTVPVAARLLPDMNVRALSDITWSERKRLPAIDLQRAPLTEAQRFVKRTMDVVVAFFALAFFLPIIVLAAVAIKLDSPGPVIFRQVRRGFNGKRFVILKFRTMTVQEDGANVVQATRGDSRLTTIGRLLRESSIDELPQLWNVLKGDMSLVGPRPHACVHDNYFETVLRDSGSTHLSVGSSKRNSLNNSLLAGKLSGDGARSALRFRRGGRVRTPIFRFTIDM
jgi:undecaprenyl-phosphate galactose phosphotransferase/putative colanic acid biosynthesis UDP-glucose lipid carrier transferase